MEPRLYVPYTDIVADEPLFIPQYHTDESAGADLRANLPEGVSVVIHPGQVLLVDCGFQVALSRGWEAQIRARSGLAKRGIQVTNSPATIDSDYRGRVGVLLNNLGPHDFLLNHAERIAQFVLSPVYRFRWNSVKDLPPSARGTGGFGSTGL